MAPLRERLRLVHSTRRRRISQKLFNSSQLPKPFTRDTRVPQKNMRHSTILALYIQCLNQEPKLETPNYEVCKHGVRSDDNSMNNGMRLIRNIIIGNTAWI